MRGHKCKKHWEWLNAADFDQLIVVGFGSSRQCSPKETGKASGLLFAMDKFAPQKRTNLLQELY